VVEYSEQEKTVVETQGKRKEQNGKRRIKLMRYSLKGRERGTYTKEDK
jgi:hypothetical protein